MSATWTAIPNDAATSSARSSASVAGPSLDSSLHSNSSPLRVHLVRVSQAFQSNCKVDEDAVGPHVSLARLLPLLDAETRRDVGKFRFLRDARRCLLGRLLRRFAVCQRLDVPWAEIAFQKTTRGRPELLLREDADRQLDFNVSHDADVVALASVTFPSQCPIRVGVDVMQVKNPWEGSSVGELIEGLAEQLSEQEIAALSDLNSDDARLERTLALWTLKESYVKAIGDGLHFDLKSLDFRFGPSSPSAGGRTANFGQAYLCGKVLEGWQFFLRQLHLDDPEGGRYWLAVAAEAAGGDGGVILDSEDQQSLALHWLSLEEILRNSQQVQPYLRSASDEIHSS
ncbi:hypothetical protein JCM10908_000143 [Rhodotorula pacifica]|uniref:holo-[acyl-carrier-protein] synthase n=1 Tax=Rhodotorula pacifica TaxID=1495444 RepID=UPI00317EDF59